MRSFVVDLRERFVRGVLSVLLLSLTAVALAEGVQRSFDIGEQPAETGLNEFARQADVTLVFSYENVAGARTKAVRGEYSIDEALRQLLDGTRLSYRQVADRTIAINNGSGSGSDLRSAEFELEEVTVTGTRVRGATPTSTVVTLARQDIERGGYLTVQGALKETVQNFSGTTASSASITSGNVGYGSQLDLRGLGPEATLTLVNGRRVAGAAGDQGRAMDVGMIPLSAVERIEILTDGASALYGSDAIGGVVNVILRRDFSGSETSAQYGFNEANADRFTVSQIGGLTWTSGRVFGAVQHTEQDALTFANLGVYSDDLRRFGGGDFRPPLVGQPGNVLPAGVFEGLPFATLTGPAGEPVFTAALPAGQNGRNLDIASLRLNDVNSGSGLAVDAAPSQEDTSVYLTVEQDVGAITLFADAAFAKRDAQNRRAANSDFLYVPTTNAFSPFDEDVVVGYVFRGDVGPLTADAANEGWFANIGARGSLPFAGWAWELLGTGSQDRSEVRITGFVDSFALADRLASSDPSYAFNPFGDGSGQSAGVIEALRTSLRFHGESRQRGVTAQAEGALFEVGGGDARLAVGGEYRHEEMDSFTATPATVLPVTPNGTRNVKALFAELYAPLVDARNARAGMREVSVSMAARFEDYSDFGKTTNPRLGLNWRPVDSLLFKASWGTSFRAPSLRELFFTTAVYPNIPMFDPRAPGGADLVFATLIQSGNMNLQEETADVYSAGLTWTPTWLRKAVISANWFTIDYTDRIRGLLDGLDIATLLDLEPSLPPGLVTRDVNGNLVSVNLTNLNSASTEVSGVDLAFSYDWDPVSIGTFGINLSATSYLKFDDQLIAGMPVRDLSGRVDSPADWRGRVDVSWQRGIWQASLSLNHVDGLTNLGADPRIVSRRVDAQTTLDAQVGVSFSSGLSLRLGVDNISGEPSPFVDGESRGGLDPQNYVIDGRTIYISATQYFGAK